MSLHNHLPPVPSKIAGEKGNSLPRAPPVLQKCRPMQTKVLTPEKQGSTEDMMKRCKHSIESPDAKEAVTSCTCQLPARPDNWSDVSWEKYKLAMACLPCDICGWAGSKFTMHPTDTFVPTESVYVAAAWSPKKPEGKTHQPQVTPGTPVRPKARVLSWLFPQSRPFRQRRGRSVLLRRLLGYGEETNEITVYEM